MNDSRSNEDGTSAGGSSEARRPELSRSRRMRLALDRLARRVVSLGGIAVILCIFAILFVIAAEVFPLFLRARLSARPALDMGTGGALLIAGQDEYREVAYVLDREGVVRFASLKAGARAPAQEPLEGLGGAQLMCAASAGGNRWAAGTSDGRILLLEIAYDVRYEGSSRSVDAAVKQGPILALPGAGGKPVLSVAYAVTPEGPLVAALLDASRVEIYRARERTSLLGDVTREESSGGFTASEGEKLTALALDNRGENLFLGTARGAVLRAPLGDLGSLSVSEELALTPERPSPVSALCLLIGDRTLVAGCEDGALVSLQLLKDEKNVPHLTRVYAFQPLLSPVRALSPSTRNKAFLAAGESHLSVGYGTSGATLASATVEGASLALVSFAPKADGLLAADGRGRVFQWDLRMPYPDVTFKGLFGKLWYEGYPGPAYVWQSTGATDDFEPKYSLIPLILGTLKGTLYAMLLAIPLALLSALYAAQFMHPSMRGVVKPTVEIMAALPSVVLGFIGGLWLAPHVEKVLPGILLLPAVTALIILLALALWKLSPRRMQRAVRPGMEFLALVPIVLLAAWISMRLGRLVETELLSGDYRTWLYSALGLPYDQRNSLVVGIAMGFAVVPLIFTIAEDSLSNVPKHLWAGSLALGATPWQTAVRVVVPTASPGIFSAIMIGFGRAVGETMIVLMATGNTPIMDWSIFNGFRALSANIAVELPEAPHGGSLFRVLFVAALLLFAMTFLVNTAAEVVRLRLRRKYQRL